MTKLLSLVFLLHCNSAFAIKTSSSFDMSYGITSISLSTVQTGSAQAPILRTISSQTGFEIDYSVALFDYKTVATMSFMQYASSSLGQIPMSRIGLGASYHFLRVNGQRIILENGVEAKIWGVSPAIEVTLGINKLSINDPGNPSFNFTASFMDLLPRMVFEIPMSSTFLLLLRTGYIFSIGGSNDFFTVKYDGFTMNIGFRLTTL